MRRRRSQLFVPASDERKITKSVALACDSIIFDLEDSVPLAEKSKARELLRSSLSKLDWGSRELCLRVNPVDSKDFIDDIRSFEMDERIGSIVLPKADLRSLERLASELRGPSKGFMPIIETARGLIEVEEIARRDGIVSLSFGAADFANSVGGNAKAYSGNEYVKTRIAVASKAYGIDPIDCVYFDLSNLEGFRDEALLAKDLGYVGKQLVHPSQIQIANEIFAPTEKEVEEARRVVDAYERAASSGTGALRLNEQLVDAVHYRQAKLVLERAKKS